MKIFRHIFVALLLLLVATTATAQSQSDNTQTKAVSATKADVNGDGVVNEADIEEIIAIMQQENGTKYYWYVGQTNPASMTSISPVVSDNTSPGWRLIGTSVPSYSDTNMLWDGVTNNIQVDKESGERAQYFVAVPNNKIQIYNGLKGSEMSNYDTSEITISGVKYYVYSYKSKGRVFGMNLY